ncbi:MAG: hypothetical protein E7612_02695 [Ruminococcaceae bacterium]|nr:hypothetical protein [Oscillospiraceae bacterium]
MKKIISLLIALSCVFALFSCDESPIDSFAQIVSSSEPTKIITLTSYNDGKNSLTGRYETQLFGSDFVMDCEYETYQIPSPGLDENEFIKSVPVTVYYRDGLYSTDGGATWSAQVPSETAMQFELNLASGKLKDYKISTDGKTLTATVSAEDTEAVLGTKLSADEDGVSIRIVHDGKSLRQIYISYVTENEGQVSYETSYSYAEIQSPFAE